LLKPRSLFSQTALTSRFAQMARGPYKRHGAKERQRVIDAFETGHLDWRVVAASNDIARSTAYRLVNSGTVFTDV
jgi:hypothetical protein